MRITIYRLFLSVAIFSFLAIADVQAQKAPKCVKVAKSNRPNWLRMDANKLTKFYWNFDEMVNFQSMRLVKSELAYYLLAKEQGGNRVFAFELEQKGKRLFLNKFYPVHSCDEGSLGLETFLQRDGKIQGCRKGNHELKQLVKPK